MRELTHEEEKLRKLYLRDLATGKIQGPPTGKASVDMPWLKRYPVEAITDELPKVTIYQYLYDAISDEPDRILINYLVVKLQQEKYCKKLIIRLSIF